MLNEIQYRWIGRYREGGLVLLLTVLAFAVRVARVDFNSLSEDESAKWAAVQEYRHGHFAGVNSEHPMLPKMSAWASLAAGERWGQIAAAHHKTSLSPEGWLRLPNVIFGAASARRWYDLSAIGFGLAFSSQYILHLLGLNALAWRLAGKSGLTAEPSRFRYGRFFFVIFLTFIVVNPVVLSPNNLHAILQWLRHDGVKHSGYDFDGKLYTNLPSRLLAGLPWFYYLWLLVVKTPIPILVAIVLGSIMLLRNRRTLTSCFFVSLGMIQLVGLSVSGAKWIRYSLPILPFLYMAGGYAVQRLGTLMKERAVPRALVGATALILFGWPLLNLHHWAPFYSFYLNSIGGGTRNIARYFAPDEVSEFDSREVAQTICPLAPRAATLATARPMSMAYYLQTCGRNDMEVVPLYDPHYLPQDGDLIVLEPSRRFFETQRFFDVLGNSGMSHREVRVGPVLASTIYRFDHSPQTARNLAEGRSTLTQLDGAPLRLDGHAQEPVSTNMSRFAFLELTRRLVQ